MIDVQNKTLIMDFDEEVVHFNIFKAMRYLSDYHSCFYVDLVEFLAQQMFNIKNKDYSRFP